MNRSAISAAALAAGFTLALAAPIGASAHVSIDPGQAEPGAYALITIKVPNESDTASTNRVELSLPLDTPFASVRYVPVPGWTVEIVRGELPEPVTVGESEITEAATSIIWTAEAGSEISNGELQLFPISVGPVPDTGSIAMPAEQNYTDGTTVNWNEKGEDSEFPAPVLFVNDAPVDHHVAGGDEGETTVVTSEPASTADSPDELDSADGLARVLGIGGLVLGAISLVLALSLRRAAK